MKALTLHYSEPLVREAVRCFFMRSIMQRLGIPFLIALCLVSVALQRLLARGVQGWIVGFLIATVLFAIFSLTALYLVHLRHGLGQLRAMQVPQATFSYDEEHFSI